MQPINVGVVGLGYWGPNLARNFAAIPGCELAWCCDESRGSASAGRPTFPSARFTADLDDLLDDPELDAVVLATPVPDPRAARRARAAGRQALLRREAAGLHGRGRRAGGRGGRAADRILMVGHLLVYHPGVAKLKEIADSGELGDIHYIYSQRLNLGQLRTDENALWSLGAHDVSVILHLAGEDPYAGRGARRGLHEPGRRGRRVRVPALPVRRRRAPAHVAGWTRTRRARSRSSAPSGWRPSTTWSSSARSPSTTRASTRTPQSYGEYITRSGDIRSPADRQPRAAADRVRALRRVHPQRAPSPAPTAKRGCASSASSPDLQEPEGYARR